MKKLLISLAIIFYSVSASGFTWFDRYKMCPELILYEMYLYEDDIC